jgi:hypothetical protein
MSKVLSLLGHLCRSVGLPGSIDTELVAHGFTPGSEGAARRVQGPSSRWPRDRQR